MGFILAIIVSNIFDILQILILIRAILSWVSHDPYNKYIVLIYNITEPVLKPIREIFPTNVGGFDFSVIIAFFIIGFIKKIILFAI